MKQQEFLIKVQSYNGELTTSFIIDCLVDGIDRRASTVRVSGAYEVKDAIMHTPPKTESFFAYHPPLRLGCFFNAVNFQDAKNKAFAQWGEEIEVDDYTLGAGYHIVSEVKFGRIIKAYYLIE